MPGARSPSGLPAADPTCRQYGLLKYGSSNIGKAYLAHLLKDRRSQLLDELDLAPRTESTYTDRDRLEAELRAVRRQGVAFNNEERFVGLRAVGAPVLGPDDEVLAAISISGPTTRLAGDRYRSEIPEKVRETARIIGIRATYS